MATATVSKRGEVVIPQEIRKRCGIRPGDRVQVVDYAGHIAIVPALEDPVRDMRGLLKGKPSLTRSLLEERRRERTREDRITKRPARTKPADA